MMEDVVHLFQQFAPEGWTTPVMILRDGGKDKYGDNQPELAFWLEPCLVGPSTTKDLMDFSERPREDLTCYAPTGIRVEPTDRLMVPDSHIEAGMYRMDGRAAYWPLGTALPIRYIRELTDVDKQRWDQEWAVRNS